MRYLNPVKFELCLEFWCLCTNLLIFQLISGVLLAMHYSPDVVNAFNSGDHIMRDGKVWFG